MNPGAKRQCPKCGAEFVAAESATPCPRCVARLAFGEPAEGQTGEGSVQARTPPTPPTPTIRVGAESLVDAGHTSPVFARRMVGDYELLEEIARGGMGVVFKARQRSLNRTVALKMILSGNLATPKDLIRFRTEAEAAARLQHPNIVAIYEVGEENELPYFSMELVQGHSLAQELDSFIAKPKAAAQLMATVARAVHHAHQRGILHRDLKPGNILLDAAGQPHIADFGLAKIVESDSDFTLSGTILGTPGYMSPEQAGGKNRQLTTASDVFSLGSILYHLLAGQPPFRGETLQETLRQVLEDEPKRPRLLQPRLDPDLETISLKCLEKEPQRRYSSAEALADDLERWLRQETIQARPATNLHRVFKWTRRHPAVAVLTSLVALLILTLAIGSTIAAVRINREAIRNRQVAQFLREMLSGVDPSSAKGRDTSILTEILTNTVGRLDRELKNQPAVEAELRNAIGAVYTALGDYTNAEFMHRQALVALDRADARESAEAATALDDLAIILYSRNNPDDLSEAERLERKALSIRKKVLPSDHRELAVSLSNLASILWAAQRPQEAEPLYLEARNVYERLLRQAPPDANVLAKEQANLLNNLANVYRSEGKLAEAETMLRKALEQYQKLGDNNDPSVATCLNSLAIVLQEQNKLAEAESFARAGLAIRQKILGSDHPAVATSLGSLAGVLRAEGKFAEAEPLLTGTLAIRRKDAPGDDPEVALLLHDLGQVMLAQGKLADAETFSSNAVAMRRSLLTIALSHGGPSGGEDLDLAESLEGSAACFSAQSRHAEAEPLLRECIAIREKKDDEARHSFTLQASLGACLLAQKKFADAEPLLLSSYAGLATNVPTNPAGAKTPATNIVESLVQLYSETGQPEKVALWKAKLPEAKAARK